MAIYTQLQEKEIREIAGRYNLTVTDFEPMAEGATNSNYLLWTQRGPYVLTLFEERTPDQVIELGQLLLLLEKHRFPTTRLLRPVDREIITIHKGKPVLLKVHIDGEVCQELDRAMLHQVGAAMAKLHRLPCPDSLNARRPYGLPEFSVVQRQNIDTEYTGWITRRLSWLEQHKPHGLPRGLVHADMFYDNLLFEDNKLKAVLDFEDALCHDKVFELGMGIVGLCRNGTTVVLEKARALVQGYQQIRELKEREKNALQFYAEYAATTVSCWRFWKYHIAAPDAKSCDKHWPMVRIAEHIRDIPESTFLMIFEKPGIS
jgi:homoserine kinase type II